MNIRAVTSRVTVLGLAVALLAACTDVNTGPDPVAIEDVEFAVELDIDLASMNRAEYGTYYEDIVIGEGAEVSAGDSIAVHWKLWLADGTLVQDSREPADDDDEEELPPADLWLVTPGGIHGGVIGGWVDGLPGMRVGGVRKLAVPWQLAYGSTRMTDNDGNTIIPPYANLVFEVELFGVTEVDESAIY